MLNALGPRTLLRAVGIAVIVLLGLSMAFLRLLDPTLVDANIWVLLWESGKLALFLLSLLFLLLSWWPALWFVHFLTGARYWLIPWLGGEWRGEVKSNWPRVEAMMNAARGDGPPFDTMRDDLPESPPIKVKARIKCRLLMMQIQFVMVGTERTSETIFVRPVRNPGERPVLYYVYRQDDLGTPPATDRRDHVGAAELKLTEDHELRGRYWTARNEERGLNTAGVLVLKRVKPRKKSRKRSTPTS